jgi:hypothetical protein
MNLKMVLLTSNGLRNSGSWAVSRSERNTELSMNRTPSPHPSPPLGERVPEGRVRGILRGSWSQCAVAEPSRLSMNLKIVLLEINDLGIRALVIMTNDEARMTKE